MQENRTVWQCKERIIDLTKPVVMGIVNVTPDSFSDGGDHATYESALAFARKLAKDGADILDIGGESTRPGFAPVPFKEEAARVLPVVETLVKEGYTVSVDTYKPQMMKEAIDLGAHIINDVRGFTEKGAVNAVSNRDIGLVVMHFEAVKVGCLFKDITDFLRERSDALMKAGIKRDQISWDPGFGFGKTMQENIELLNHFEDFDSEGFPILIGVSRKRMIGQLTGIANPKERCAGSVKAALEAIEKGAHIVRVHDVKETLEALKTAGLR